MRDGRQNLIREGLPSNSIPQLVIGIDFKERVRKKVSSVLK